MPRSRTAFNRKLHFNHVLAQIGGVGSSSIPSAIVYDPSASSTAQRTNKQAHAAPTAYGARARARAGGGGVGGRAYRWMYMQYHAPVFVLFFVWSTGVVSSRATNLAGLRTVWHRLVDRF